jgi:deoxycytidine triphosphate deaminase
LADREVKRLIGTVLVDADEIRINPNGIELRLGKHVHFHSTREDATLAAGQFLKVNPGETVVISSLEQIDFSAETVHRLLPKSMLMGLITPTTTMMREGISQVATKIDAGFRGNLNWSLRNCSTHDLVLQHGEPIFKLTLFQLDEGETPDLPYGERPGDDYQNTEGIRGSTRRIPADIPRSKIVASSFDRLDPKRQLREAGYPFDHIGTELTDLHGRFEVVSTDVRMMKDEFQRRTAELSEKIVGETNALGKKLEEDRKSMLEKVESLFDRKFFRIAGIIIGALPVMYGGVTLLSGIGLGGKGVSFVAMVAGIAVVLLTLVLTRRPR